jgi:sigma-54 specific flagellar transcriptional regulator A
MSSIRLSGADRDFLSALVHVVFGNPYSRERAALIVRLAPDAPLGDLTEHRDALARVAGQRLEPLLRDGPAGLRQLGAEDRRLLEPAFLYVSYHRYVPELDALIERQAQQGGVPLPVPFAEEAITDLVRSGFDEARAVRYFALFYQLRRAFYFIHGSLAGECESMQRLRESLWNNVFTHDMRGYDEVLWSRMEDFSTLLRSICPSFPRR